MLIDERAVETLFCREADVEVEDIRETDRLRAIISEFFLVCEGALFGMTGASSPSALVRDGAPK